MKDWTFNWYPKISLILRNLYKKFFYIRWLFLHSRQKKIDYIFTLSNCIFLKAKHYNGLPLKMKFCQYNRFNPAKQVTESKKQKETKKCIFSVQSFSKVQIAANFFCLDNWTKSFVSVWKKRENILVCSCLSNIYVSYC